MNSNLVVLLFGVISSFGLPQESILPGIIFEPASCSTQKTVAFTSTLPNASVCRQSLENVLSRVTGTVNTSVLTNDLDIVCTTSCGGKLFTFLRADTCNETLGALILELSCTMTNETADVGPYCRFALDDIDPETIFVALYACDNLNGTVCEPGCREALTELKSQFGCCYQNLFNNTEYLMQLLAQDLITRQHFDGFFELSNPQGNPWDLCGVTAPMSCPGEPFGKSIIIQVAGEL